MSTTRAKGSLASPGTMASTLAGRGASAPRGALARAVGLVVLPKNITAFEQSYLKRINRIALRFFYAHLPVFMGVAWINDTGVVPVALMTLAVLAVPFLGCRALTSERAKSYVFAFTSMCMGGVLVHAGQGPVQIEMHFYFFSILAMLALFANPMTVIVGAGTVAVHHLALWYLAPASVFNYEAPLWVVLVHAGFVVLEAVATCFIARNFFDHVIGLERKVVERTAELSRRNQEMQVVLDSIEQGIVTLDAEGRLFAEHSPAFVDFFGAFDAGETLADVLSRSCVATAEWFSMSWEAIEEGFLPIELTVDQLPRRTRVGARTFQFEYRPTLDERSEIRTMLVVVSDITGDLAREAAESVRRESLVLLERAMGDRGGFASFYAESNKLIGSVIHAGSAAPTLEQRRALHTMKGNAAAFGLTSVSKACHALEEVWDHPAAGSLDSAMGDLNSRWRELDEIAGHLHAAAPGSSLMVEPSELEHLRALAMDAGASEVAASIATLLQESTSPALERLELQALEMGERLGRGSMEVVIESHGTRVPRGRFQTLWSALVHVVRNAVDHGIESEEERALAAKEGPARLTISTVVVDDSLVITVEDNGRGVDWEQVATKASDLGLPASNRSELVHALFAAELSTRENVTEWSGRGMGLSAVAEAVDQLGGSLEVHSEPGEGTCMAFKLPLDGAFVQIHAAA